jgi:hypothetical protein
MEADTFQILPWPPMSQETLPDFEFIRILRVGRWTDTSGLSLANVHLRRVPTGAMELLPGSVAAE